MSLEQQVYEANLTSLKHYNPWHNMLLLLDHDMSINLHLTRTLLRNVVNLVSGMLQFDWLKAKICLN